MALLLLNTTIKISLIVSAALFATALLRRRSAAVRHFVLAAALACAAATPFVRIVAPAWRTASALQVIDRPLAVFDDSGTVSSSTVTRGSRPALGRADVMRAVSLVWMTGVALALTVLAIGLGRLWWIASRARRIDHGPWAEIAAAISRAYDLRRPPLVLHSAQTAVLGTWGVTHAKVLVPSDALDWPADRIRIVLGHELAHVRRGDWIVQVAVDVLCAAHWFNPLVWFAARRLRLESEHACDDAVLTMGVEGAAYASELVDLARAFRAARQTFVPAAPIARPSTLERRVRAMLNATSNRDPITRSASIAAALVLASVTMLVAGFGVSAQGQFASVFGTITDQNSRTVNGVRLVLSNAAAQTKNEVKTDASGHYEFVGLPAGTYDLMAELPGMMTLKREGLTLSGQAVQVNAAMQLGSVQETIRVTPEITSSPRVFGYSGPRPADTPDACASSVNGGCIRPPVKIRDVRPVYPAGAPAGSVELKGIIDANGLMAGIDVVGNGSGGAANPVLADAAAEAVRQWEFKPTHLDGQPIEVNITVRVFFGNY